MMFKSFEPMNKHCSFNLGGKARWYAEPKSVGQLKEIISQCKEFQREFFILGNGTNVICPDKGFPGVVICTKKLDGIVMEQDASGYVITAMAGVDLLKLNKFLAQCGVGGMEWSYGIPGTVGGAVKMNAGAYGGEIFNHISSVDVLKDNKIKRLKKQSIPFSYRNGGIDGVVIRVKLFFPKGDEDSVAEHNISNGEETSQNTGDLWLAKQISSAQSRKTNIEKTQMEIMKRRLQSQPLNFPSAGSIFKRGDLIPAQIIDKLGLKGAIIGKAMVSNKHAGFIVNIGGATACDVLKLIELVQDKVFKETGVMLEKEIVVIGEK